MDSLVSMGRFGIFSLRVLKRLLLGPWNVEAFFKHTWIVVLRCTLPVVAVV
ncbi:MAG: hypothetical protein H6741_35375, partial [Alphaproteobacteria bacterium]|nr:hypothetical protein [Alphaproteobacteria bacterium]